MFKRILLFLFIAAIVAGIFGYGKYNQVFSPNVPEELKQAYINIPTNASFEEIRDRLHNQGFLIDSTAFTWVAEQMSYKRTKMRSGRFKIEPGWSNRRLIQHLRNGKQSPVKLVLTNERLPNEIAGKVARFIEADSLSVQRLITNEEYLSKHQLTPQTMITAIVPNTYEFFWNTNAEQFFERMIKERDKFWGKNNRIFKAQKLNLSKEEIYTLASIVERETNSKAEKPRIAGVYYNRLQKGMLLQADPTVVFATGEFGLRRVLNRHLEFDSPYNTYQNLGLPPGPISMASITSLDAVIDVEDHDYIFFCAKGDGSGTHAFAKTLSGHNRNAARYRQNLKKRGLR
ncbi:MAG: endolytic transglycosylase MltG [Bacteroidota bacterium]